MTFVSGKDIQISWSRQTCSGNIALVLFAVKESKPCRYLQWKQYWTQRQHKTKRTAEFYDRISHWVGVGWGGGAGRGEKYSNILFPASHSLSLSGVMTWSLLESKRWKKNTTKLRLHFEEEVDDNEEDEEGQTTSSAVVLADNWDIVTVQRIFMYHMALHILLLTYITVYIRVHNHLSKYNTTSYLTIMHRVVRKSCLIIIWILSHCRKNSLFV